MLIEQVSVKEYIKKDIQKTAIIHFITGFIIISLFSLIYTSFANALLNGLIFSSIVSGYYCFMEDFLGIKELKDLRFMEDFLGIKELKDLLRKSIKLYLSLEYYSIRTTLYMKEFIKTF